jgi:hypothetical protein
VLFAVAVSGLVGCYLWAFSGLPSFGNYPGPYGRAILAHAIAQTHATGVVSAIEAAAARDVPRTSPAVRGVALLLVAPTVVLGWWLGTHAQTNPSGGFQGGVVLAIAFMLVYLSGDLRTARRLRPEAVVDAAEAIGAGGVRRCRRHRRRAWLSLPLQLPAAGQDPRLGQLVGHDRVDQPAGRDRGGGRVRGDHRGAARAVADRAAASARTWPRQPAATRQPGVIRGNRLMQIFPFLVWSCSASAT